MHQGICAFCGRFIERLEPRHKDENWIGTVARALCEHCGPLTLYFNREGDLVDMQTEPQFDFPDFGANADELEDDMPPSDDDGAVIW